MHKHLCGWRPHPTCQAKQAMPAREGEEGGEWTVGGQRLSAEAEAMCPRPCTLGLGSSRHSSRGQPPGPPQPTARASIAPRWPRLMRSILAPHQKHSSSWTSGGPVPRSHVEASASSPGGSLSQRKCRQQPWQAPGMQICPLPAPPCRRRGRAGHASSSGPRRLHPASTPAGKALCKKPRQLAAFE
eukprot:UN1006